MMDSDRKYEPIQVEMIGVENGFARFEQDGIARLPPVAKWRNNLTALSQHENLFFIASAESIAVHEPEFPYQILGGDYSLLIKPELANPRAPGYLSTRRDGVDDHCINHLIVGQLGSQEILVLATDSGNITAYYTSSIAEAIRRNHGQEQVNSHSDALGLRPFFSHWVQQSAWGLDIHQHARMIAVSSNVPNDGQPGSTEDSSSTITVFAFALVDRPPDASVDSPVPDWDDTNDDSSAPGSEWEIWDASVNSTPPNRDRNYKIRLAGWDGHGNNIPNISFVDTPDEEGGIWLLSTDIMGQMKLWQVWKSSCFRTWFFGPQHNTVTPWMHQQFPGWNVVAIDVNCFRPARSMEEFIGANKAGMYHGYQDQGPNFNLTPIVSRLPSNGRYHPSHPDSINDGPPSDEDELIEESEDESDEDDPVTTINTNNAPTTSRSRSPDFSALAAEHSTTVLPNLQPFDRPVHYEIEMYDSASDSETDDDLDLYLDHGDTSSATSPSPQSPPAPVPERMQRAIRRQVTPIQNPNIKTPNVALIHCSDSHIRLLGSPRARFPHIFCAHILRQILPQDLHTHLPGLEFMHMDRLNMLHKIPELGVVLIATQTGRVAVCALTRNSNNLLGLRIDFVLPTKTEEQNGRRPQFCALIGMAISPIQGRTKGSASPDTDASSAAEESWSWPNTKPVDIDGVRTSFDDQVVIMRQHVTPSERHAWSKAGTPPEPDIETRVWKDLEEIEDWRVYEVSRRYRLMLTYSDLSVLTYEISRGVEKHERA